MKQNKEFDCIRMKEEIQARLIREVEEFGEEEAARRREQRLANDPVLGPFLKRMEAEGRMPARKGPAARSG